MDGLRAWSGQPAAVHLVFFPAAQLLALTAVPLWAAFYRAAPEMQAWHAHEMVFGYALAVVAGFLLARLERGWLALLVALWLLARLAPLWPLLGGAASLGFTLALAGLGAARFLRAARKGSNRAFAVILLAFALGDALALASRLGAGVASGSGLRLGLDLLVLLMLQMGGRIIPAAAGALYRRGEVLATRVQPRLERALAALMAVLILADLAGLTRLAGGAAGLAAILAVIRLLRWRPWKVAREAELLGLALGYAWLVAALALKAAADGLGLLPRILADHALGVGALGTLTLVMMVRTAAGRARRAPGRELPAIIALVSGAALLRLWGAQSGSPAAIAAAAALWALAFGLALAATAKPALGSKGNPAA
jgi:uncharacterized protein involved in response to NO